MSALSKLEIEEVREVFQLEQDSVLTAILTELQAMRLIGEGQTWLLRVTVLALIALAGLNVAGKFWGA